MSLNIVFAGTPDFAADILTVLIRSEHKVEAIFTQPDRPKGRGQSLAVSPVKKIALHHEIPVFQPTTLRDELIQSKLKEMKPDVMIVAAYGLILPSTVLSLPKWGCLNVHASLLPHYRGASPIQYAILNGDALTGITIMQMDEGLDTGAILTQYPCPIEMHETSASLMQRLAHLGSRLLLETLTKLENKTLKPAPQEDSQASYAPKITKQEAKIDWNEPAIIIDRKIRAYNPWPIAHTLINGQILRLYSAEVVDAGSEGPPGTIMAANAQGILVSTQESLLRLSLLQLPGGKILKASDLLNSKASLFSPGRMLGE